jgi:hypothetical protein
MTIRSIDPRQRFAAFGQKASADFTQKVANRVDAFRVLVTGWVTSTFPPVGLGPLQPWGPLFVQHSEKKWWLP